MRQEHNFTLNTLLSIMTLPSSLWSHSLLLTYSNYLFIRDTIHDSFNIDRHYSLRTIVIPRAAMRMFDDIDLEGETLWNKEVHHFLSVSFTPIDLFLPLGP